MRLFRTVQNLPLAAKQSVNISETFRNNVFLIFLNHEKYYILFVSCLICVCYSAYLGQDQNWDAANYHFYNAYAFLNGRMDFDIAPAQLQTWFNPTFSIFILLIATYLPAFLASAVLAALGGINIALVYFLARAVQSSPKDLDQHITFTIVSLATALLAFYSPMFFSELGTTFGDYIGSLLSIAALLLVIRFDFSIRGYAWAGLCLGLALSIKLTNATSVIAFTCATLVMTTRPGQWFGAIPRLFAAGLSALLIFLPLGGAWLIYIYQRFGNPIFPLYNNLFKSPWIEPDGMLDERFKAKSWADAVAYPWKTAIGLHPSAELFFTDYRLLTLIVALVVVGFFLLFPKLHNFKGTTFQRRPVLFLTLFIAVFFVTWLTSYGIERYAIVIVQLIPLLIFALIACLNINRTVYIRCVLGLTVFLTVTTIPANWGRVNSGLDWFSFSIPAEARVENRLYIFHADDAESFVTLALPASSRFVRISGNFPITPNYKLFHAAKAAILNHKGEIYHIHSLTAGDPTSKAPFAAFGLERASGPCFDITSKVGSIRSCPLKRMATP